MVNLENVTLVAMTSVKISETIKALEFSCRGVKFGKVKLVSDIKPDNLPDYIQHEYTERMNNIDEWNYSSIYKLGKHIDTEFVMLIHDDGFVINPDSWRDDFLDYDYIGAPWPKSNLERSSARWKLVEMSYTNSNKTYCIGNGGFALRTKKLMEMVSKLYLDEYYGIPEDLVISVILRKQLEELGFKFPTSIELAGKFSCESQFVDGYILSSNNSFGFHCDETHKDKIRLLDESYI